MKLEEQRPGVHVKGDVMSSPHDGRLSKEHSDISDADDIEEDEPIQMKIKTKPKEEIARLGATAESTPNKHSTEDTHSQSPISIALASLVHEKGIQAGRRDSSSSILTQLLNTPSTNPGKSSVGQVLAEVLQKASEEAATKEPKRAASLRNLANYFSEKEKAGKTEQETIPEDDSPPVSPPSIPVYSPLPGTVLGGGILTRMLAGTSGIMAGIPAPRPIATVAGATNSTTTTSTTPGLLPQPRFNRTSSGTNLKGLDVNALGSPDKRLSLDATDLMTSNANFSNDSPSFPTLRRRASSGDLESMSSSNDLASSVNSLGLGTRLYRSNSSGSLADLSQAAAKPPAATPNPGGFFGRLTRRPSLGSLTDLVQRSNLGSLPISPPGRLERSNSLDNSMVSRPGQSPPSPSHFDTNRPFFSATPESSKGFFSGAKLSSFAGVRANVSPHVPSSASQATIPQAASTKSEERLEKINKAFAFEDFGGMGLMSFFGNKRSGQNK